MSNSSCLGSGQSRARGYLVKDWPSVREKLRPTPVHLWSDWAVTVRCPETSQKAEPWRTWMEKAWRCLPGASQGVLCAPISQWSPAEQQGQIGHALGNSVGLYSMGSVDTHQQEAEVDLGW